MLWVYVVTTSRMSRDCDSSPPSRVQKNMQNDHVHVDWCVVSESTEAAQRCCQKSYCTARAHAFWFITDHTPKWSEAGGALCAML